MLLGEVVYFIELSGNSLGRDVFKKYNRYLHVHYGPELMAIAQWSNNKRP